MITLLRALGAQELDRRKMHKYSGHDFKSWVGRWARVIIILLHFTITCIFYMFVINITFTKITHKKKEKSMPMAYNISVIV